MSNTRKVLYSIGGFYVFGLVLLAVVFGVTSKKNTTFQIQNEFKLINWVPLGVFSINRAVVYLILAAIATVVTMVWIARRMQGRPNRVQTAVEVLFSLMRDNITQGNMDDSMAAKWFPFIGALFLFIWFSNLIGFLPLPTNTEHTFTVFGLEIPSFAIYAATANLSIPLVLTLVVWISYHVEGIRAKGLFKYLASWLPPGLEDMNPAAKAFIFVIEAISQFARLISLSVRLFANILAGHLLLLFMGGGLAVLLGIAALGALTFPLAFFFFILELGLIATLQAFIFSILTAIYLGGATSASH